MTDKYESEGTADQEQIATETENWGGEPPVDDFHVGEESATVSEEADAHDETGTEQTVAAKKSMLIPIAAGVGGLLILGAVLYWQFGGSSDAQMPIAEVPPLSTQTADATPPETVQPSAPAPTDNANKAPVSDVAPTTALAPVADIPAKPISAAPASATPDATAVALPPKPAAAPMAMPAPLPAPVAVAAPAPVQTAPAIVPPPSSIAPQASSTEDARIVALSNRVEDLQKSLAQATQQLTQVNAALASRTASADTGSSPALDDRLSKIEQKLMQVQHAAPASSIDANAGFDAAPHKAYVGKTHHTSYKSHYSHKTVVKKTSHRMAMLPQEKPAIMAPSWVLRAASPDEAWVAQDSFTPELRRVRVGDSLPGVGAVRAIHQTGDIWVVEGSQGTIR